MTYEISHQRLNFSFLENCLPWSACGKPSSQTYRVKGRENQFTHTQKNKQTHPHQNKPTNLPKPQATNEVMD